MLFDLFESKNKKIKDLKKQNEELKEIIKKQNKKLNILLELKNFKFNNDFNFPAVDKVISIEGIIEKPGLIKCIICYTLKSADKEDSDLTYYKEWTCWCNIEQYNYLYNEYNKFKNGEDK